MVAAQNNIDISQDILTAEERDWLTRHPVIRIGVDNAWPPLEFVNEDGEYTGIASEFLALIEKRLGIELRIEKTKSWADVVKAVKSGELDGFSLVVETPQRKEYVEFTNTYLSFPYVIVTLEDKSFIDGIDGLLGQTVAVTENYATHDILKRNHPDLDLLLAGTVKTGLEAVVTGRAHAFVGNLAVISEVLREAGITNLKVSGQTQYRSNLAMAFRKDLKPAVSIFNKALASITSMERDAIYARWVRLQFDTKIDPTIILIVILVSSLIVSAIILRNRKLRLKILNNAKEELEQRVIERTAELDVALKTQENLNILLADQNEELARMQEELQSVYDVIKVQKERMEAELSVAHEIQMSMVPLIFPAFPNRGEFTVFAVLEPAREVGGDFYDFFFIDEDNFCVCIGDVSGKGVPAALFMAVAKTLIKSRATADFSTASILTHVNDELSADNKECMFVTLFIGIINIISGEVLYTSAGHNPTYIRRKNGKLLSLDEVHGPMVGAMEGMVYGENRVKLDPADILVLYTDGVTEAMDAENNMFSDERLIGLLETMDVDTVESMVKDIVADVVIFEDGAEQTDDVTVLAFQFHGSSGASSMAELQISIKNELSEIAKIIEAFEAFAGEHGLPMPITMKFDIIFDELLNNVISYAFRDDDNHEINTHVEFLADRLTVTITDDGAPFNPLSAKAPDTKASLEDRDTGGLGIHLVRSLVDDVSYHRGIGKNVVTLVKQLGPDDI